MSISKIMRWAVAGGILLTCACREDTRHKAKEAAGAVADEVKDGVQEAKRGAGKVAERARDAATNAIQEVGRTADQLKEDAKPYVKAAEKTARKTGRVAKKKTSEAAHDVIEKGKKIIDEVTGGTATDQPADASTDGA